MLLSRILNIAIEVVSLFPNANIADDQVFVVLRHGLPVSLAGQRMRNRFPLSNGGLCVDNYKDDIVVGLCQQSSPFCMVYEWWFGGVEQVKDVSFHGIVVNHMQT